MKKILFALFVVGITGITYADNLDFNGFQAGDPIQNKFSLVHFTLPDTTKNDYQGSIFWLPSKQIIPAVQIAGPNGQTRSCSKLVRGLYYTNAKGERLWPLDTQTLSGLRLLNSDYDALKVEGGIYTTCGASGDVEIYSLYGQITYKDANTNAILGSLTAGLMYDPSANAISTAHPGLYPSLQYFNNQTPIGYIFDDVAGIGFIGGSMEASGHEAALASIQSGGAINTIFNFSSTSLIELTNTQYAVSNDISAGMNTLWNISVLGNVLLSRGGLDARDRQSVLGNPSISSAIVFSDIINTSDILNKLRKNGDALCRGRDVISEISGDFSQTTDPVICVENSLGDTSYNPGDAPLVIDLGNPLLYDGKTFVVHGRNVILKGSVPEKKDAINLFVDNGNILLQAGTFATGGDDFGTFDKDGAKLPDRAADVISAAGGLDQAGATGVNYGVYLRGNIFANGIIAGWDGHAIAPIANKYYFHGRLASLNTALEPSTPRNTLIQNIFGSDAPLYAGFVNLNNVFVWQCQLNGYATDGVQPCQVDGDMFKFNPFVLIKTQIANKLLQ